MRRHPFEHTALHVLPAESLTANEARALRCAQLFSRQLFPVGCCAGCVMCRYFVVRGVRRPEVCRLQVAVWVGDVT